MQLNAAKLYSPSDRGSDSRICAFPLLRRLRGFAAKLADESVFCHVTTARASCV